MVTLDLSTLPARMKSLPIDERGYPIPFFVAYVDGKPEFRAMDMAKFLAAIKQKLCWVCGEKLGVHVAFVAGPMCGINRTSPEPPSHRECAEWSAINCPFLNNPRAVRREDDDHNNQKFREMAPGFAITRNPGVAMVWITREFDVYNPGIGGPGYLIEMGEPEEVLFFREGRKATRAEVVESVESGLPKLEAVAVQEEGGLEVLARHVKRFQRHLPVE